MCITTENKSFNYQEKIVHIGLGAFHRAHQALYTSELLSNTKVDNSWTICSINLFGSQDLVNQINQQGNSYAVLERGTNNEELKISKAITTSLHPAINGEKIVIEKLANEDIAIVSLTITEKGYCIEPSSGVLDTTNPLIQKDLHTPRHPSSAIGYIVEGLRLRKERAIKAFTVLSCDNIQSNGDVAKKAVLSFAKKIDESLYQWIKENVTFPNTMVDRIVPAMTPEALMYIEQKLGYSDPCAITCEPFRQWVIEDRFVNGRPNWNLVGANFVDDVRPFEEMKLRMLNGSHSFLAYIGYLSSYKFISEAISDPNFKTVILEFMLNEQSPSLNLPKDVDINHYAHLLIERFSNPNLQHSTSQIATDGSQKLSPRFCESLKYNRKYNFQTKWLELGIAGWMYYVAGTSNKDQEIIVIDPLKDTFKNIKHTHHNSRDIVLSLLNLSNIFDPNIQKDSALVENIILKFESIKNIGAKRTLELMLKQG